VLLQLCLMLAAGCGRAGTEPAAARPAAIPDQADESPRTRLADRTDDSDLGQITAQPSTPAPIDSPETTQTDTPQIAQVASTYRKSDDRPVHDTQRLRAAGIRKYESKHCVIYTDIDEEIARSLPPFVDALHVALTDYFGELPPNREGTQYQVTGYIMKDQQLYRKLGLLPKDLPQFEHGRHAGYEFWMNDQDFDYYRRHLMLHEATHCFMTCATERTNAPPAWYMEGMAEWFATHRVIDDKIAVAVMQDNTHDFGGFGRVRVVRNAVAAGKTIPFDRLLALMPGEFLDTEHYAQSWVTCQFLNRHPVYRNRFRELGQLRTYEPFIIGMTTAFAPDHEQLRSELDLLLRELQIGHDFERTAIRFSPTESPRGAKTVSITADRGWQSSGVLVVPDSSYSIAATGQVVLAKQPKPWNSQPQGITIRYCEGQPIGQLQAIILNQSSNRFGNVIPIGQSATIEVKTTGTLFLRVNDYAAELADNSGSYSVTIQSTD
jgi:hypothetical protein